MTQEEKAKAYDEALEKIKVLQEDWKSTHNRAWKEIEEVFPQLTESEDERIRKEIISIVKEYGRICEKEGDPCGTIGDCLTYLEKQKEQNHDGKKWIFEDEYQKDLDRLYNEGKDEVLNNPAKYGLQKEQKLALTIYPKFAVGDTVCRPMWSDHTIREIYVRCNDPVYICVNEEGTESDISFSEQDEWERKEQKPFDDTQEYLKGVDRVQNYEELTKFEKGFDCIADTYAHRKNKEGYNKPWYTKERAAEMLYWAKEELGLLNVQKPTVWSEEDRKHLNSVLLSLNRPFYNMNEQEKSDFDWLHELPERFNLQPKQEWSEKDEKMLRSCCAAIIYDNSFTYDERCAMEDWLKGRFNLLCPVKQEWSEEDIENGSYISAFLQANCENNEILKKATTWFMSRFKSLYPVKQEWSDEDEEKFGNIHGPSDAKMRTCDKLEMEKLYGEEY